MGMGWGEGVVCFILFSALFKIVVKYHGGFLSRGITRSNLGFTKEWTGVFI